MAVAAKIGRSIDFLHIDGAHSEEQANFDAMHWFELVSPGGTIVLDDIDWTGVRDAAAFLSDRYEEIERTAWQNLRFRGFSGSMIFYRSPSVDHVRRSGMS